MNFNIDYVQSLLFVVLIWFPLRLMGACWSCILCPLDTTTVAFLAFWCDKLLQIHLLHFLSLT